MAVGKVVGSCICAGTEPQLLVTIEHGLATMDGIDWMWWSSQVRLVMAENMLDKLHRKRRTLDTCNEEKSQLLPSS